MYVVVVVEMLTCLANAFLINVVIICFGFVNLLVGPVVLCLEPLEVIRFHYCFLDLGFVVGGDPFIVDFEHGATSLVWSISKGIPCNRSSFASRSAG